PRGRRARCPRTPPPRPRTPGSAGTGRIRRRGGGRAPRPSRRRAARPTTGSPRRRQATRRRTRPGRPRRCARREARARAAPWRCPRLGARPAGSSRPFPQPSRSRPGMAGPALLPCGPARRAESGTILHARDAPGNAMSATRETAVLGGGCFCCLEAVFEQLQGVEKVVSGYAGGFVPNPTYDQVCGEGTGHAEVVQVTFDPSVISYRDLLEVFFTIHDPTTPNRQGNDEGTQYRSTILYAGPAQKATAEEVMRTFAREAWGEKVVTESAPLKEFYPAESHHQGYYRRNPSQGYCRVVIAPKVAKFRKAWEKRLKA